MAVAPEDAKARHVDVPTCLSHQLSMQKVMKLFLFFFYFQKVVLAQARTEDLSRVRRT